MRNHSVSWGSHNLQPNYKRPPQHPGSLQSAIPSWERRFCTSVCSIPWGKICVAKASLSAYKNIAQWDDAAALEAFQNAKARYWAHMNRLPFVIPLPDPNMYLDIVDHKAVIDPKLVEDLEEQQPPPLHNENNEESNGSDSGIFENKPIPNEGADEHRSVNWDKFVENQLSGNGGSSNAWNPRVDGWGDVNDSWNKGNFDSSNAWNCHGGVWGDANNSWNNGRDAWRGQHWSNLNNEQGWRNNRKRKGDHGDPQFVKSRHVNNYQANKNNSNYFVERNMEDHTYDRTMRGGQPVFMPLSKSRWFYGMSNHQRCAETGGAWYWEKSATWFGI